MVYVEYMALIKMVVADTTLTYILVLDRQKMKTNKKNLLFPYRSNILYISERFSNNDNATTLICWQTIGFIAFLKMLESLP